MASRAIRLLCRGKEPELLRTRCAVLRYPGHDAQAATLPEAEVLLRSGEEFDLMIVFSSSSEWEKGRILSSAGETRTYILRGLTLAEELLAQVARPLAPDDRQKQLR
jgi:hypothetical protein